MFTKFEHSLEVETLPGESDLLGTQVFEMSENSFRLERVKFWDEND